MPNITINIEDQGAPPMVTVEQAPEETLKAYNEGEPAEDVVLKPYPNEHAARLRSPGDFNPDTFRRTRDGTIYGSKKVPNTIGVIWGKLKGSDAPDDPPIPQALRFPTKDWTAAAAKKWLSDNKVKHQAFEAAAGKSLDDDNGWDDETVVDETAEGQKGPYGRFDRFEELAETHAELQTLIGKGEARYKFIQPVSIKADVQDVGNRRVPVRLTMAIVDDDKEVLLPKGMNIKRYRKLPVVLWSHQWAEMPVGRNIWPFKIMDDEVRSVAEMLPEGIDTRADGIVRYLDSGFPLGVSVGVRYDEVHPPTERELRAHPEWAGARQIVSKWTLYEYSFTPVGSNPEAMALGIEKGRITSASLRLLELPVKVTVVPAAVQEFAPKQKKCYTVTERVVRPRRHTRI